MKRDIRRSDYIFKMLVNFPTQEAGLSIGKEKILHLLRIYVMKLGQNISVIVTITPKGLELAPKP